MLVRQHILFQIYIRWKMNNQNVGDWAPIENVENVGDWAPIENEENLVLIENEEILVIIVRREENLVPLQVLQLAVLQLLLMNQGLIRI